MTTPSGPGGSAARDRGLRVVCLADHVRQGSLRVPDFVAAVRELRPAPGIEVLAGVEAKILNSAGELDLPDSLRGVDRILIADHQYPGDHGPVPPQDMRDALGHRQCSHLAQGCFRAGARVEVNEKWACPSPRTIRALAAAGVPLVASTDSHDCATVGRYQRVRGILDDAFSEAVPG